MKIQFSISISILILIISSCQQYKSKCDNSEVKFNTLLKFKEEIRSKLIKEYEIENLNYDDIKTYSIDNNIPFKEVYSNELLRIRDDAETNTTKLLSNTKLLNVRTEKLEEEIKKCSCIADIQNDFLSPMSVKYTVQTSEDTKKDIIEIELISN